MKLRTDVIVAVILILAGVIWSCSSKAENREGGQEENSKNHRSENGHPGGDSGKSGHPKPPREALEACSGKVSGIVCTFKGRNAEQVEGKCWSPSESLPLACKPDHGGR